MPLLTRWVIKTSFVYLGIALAIGILLAGQSLWRLPVFIATLFPDYIHLLVVGWLTLLIFGVAYWMFPKYSLEHPHGSEPQNWSAYLLLNMGLVIRIVVEPILPQSQGTLLGWLLVVSALLQWLGGMALLITLWKRVKGR
jgi:hypothetical protein